MTRNRDSHGMYKAQMNDGERRPRKRRTPEEIEAARLRMEQQRRDLDEMTARHFPALARAIETKEGN